MLTEKDNDKTEDRHSSKLKKLWTKSPKIEQIKEFSQDSRANFPTPHPFKEL